MDDNQPLDTPPEPTPPGGDENFEVASQSTADFIKNVQPLQAQKKKRRKSGRIFLMVLLLLAVGGGVAYMLTRPEERKPTTQQTPPPPPQTTDQQEALTEKYTSQDLQLMLEHPKSWKVDDDTSRQLKLESPLIKVETADGDQADGKVVITILGAGSTPEDFAGTTATATIDAEKIAYTAPSQIQRKETYLSFMSFGTSSGIDAIFITGDNGYQKGQTVPKTDAVRGDPIVSVAFAKCTNSTSCQGKLSIAPDGWASNKTLATAKTIIQSLVIQ